MPPPWVCTMHGIGPSAVVGSVDVEVDVVAVDAA